MNHLLTLCFTQGWSQLTKGMTLREIQQQGAEPKKTPWLLDFKKRLATQGLSEATIRGYSYDLQVFCEWSKAFRDTAELKGLTETDLNAYRRFLLKEKNLKANTVNRRLLSLKKAITWGTKKGQVTEGMAGSVRLVPKGEKRLPKALNLKEVHALLRASGLSPHGQAKRVALAPCNHGRGLCHRPTRSMTAGARIMSPTIPERVPRVLDSVT